MTTQPFRGVLTDVVYKKYQPSEFRLQRLGRADHLAHILRAVFIYARCRAVECVDAEYATNRSP